MSSLKDLERSTRLYDKEIDTLADQLAQKEAFLRLEVDRLRLGLEAIKRYLSARDSGFLDTYRRHKRQLLREVAEAEEE